MKFSNHVKTNNKPNCNYHSATLSCILSYVVHAADIRRFIFWISSYVTFNFTIVICPYFFLSLKNPGDRRRTRVVRRARHETLEEEEETEV